MMTRSKQDFGQDKTKEHMNLSQNTQSKDHEAEDCVTALEDATSPGENIRSGRSKTPTRTQMWDILVEIRNNMKDLVKQNKDLADEIKEMKRSLEINDAELIELKKENAVLHKHVHETSAKCESLVRKLVEVDQQQDELEQYSRKVCLVIRGIPEKSQENVEEIVVNLAKKLDAPIENDDVEIVHRIASKSPGSKPIIVRFWNYKLKQKFYAARFKLRNVRVTDIIGGRSNQKNSTIYITESLTKKRSQILAACVRAKKSSERIESVWTLDRKIFIKEHTSGKAIRINSIEQIEHYISVDST